MSWVTPTAEMMFADSSVELAGIVAVKGQDDRAQILTEAVETFRDAIRSGGQALAVTDGTIPLSCQQACIDKAIWIFVTRSMPENDAIQSKARREANARAEAFLADIINKKIRFSGDDPAQSIGYAASTPRPGRQVRTDSFDGLGQT
jgi:hypothetical protein